MLLFSLMVSAKLIAGSRTELSAQPQCALFEVSACTSAQQLCSVTLHYSNCEPLVAEISPCELEKNCSRSGEFFSYIRGYASYMEGKKVTGFEIQVVGERDTRMLGVAAGQREASV